MWVLTWHRGMKGVGTHMAQGDEGCGYSHGTGVLGVWVLTWHRGMRGVGTHMAQGDEGCGYSHGTRG